MSEWLALLLCIQEVHDSNSFLETRYLDLGVLYIFSFPVGKYWLKLGNDLFLPCPFTFIIHQSS
jgi:hypothetical protein